MSRFNNLTRDEDISEFQCFYVSPCRNDMSAAEIAGEAGTCIVQCEAGSAEFWGIYGNRDSIESEAIHDAPSATEAVRILAQLVRETNAAISVYEEGHGITLRRRSLIGCAQDVTDWIHDDLPDSEDPDASEDDFDNHDLAELREAFVTYSDYAGLNTARDPYQPVEGETA